MLLVLAWAFAQERPKSAIFMFQFESTSKFSDLLILDCEGEDGGAWKREEKRYILHIAMNEARGVDELQALEDVDGQLHDKGEGERVVGIMDDVVQAPSAHQLGHHAEIGWLHAHSHEQNDISSQSQKKEKKKMMKREREGKERKGERARWDTGMSETHHHG